MTRTLGVIIVAYNSADVILPCLQTLFAAAQGTPLHVVVVDNACPRASGDIAARWAKAPSPIASKDAPFKVSRLPENIAVQFTLLRSPTNGGFAAGVNLGLRELQRDPKIDRFWILNPDTLSPPGTPQALAQYEKPFALMGGRIAYAAPPHRIQIDAGCINWRTGVTSNLSLGQCARSTPLPDMSKIDFISGAHMVASRAFVEQAGPMPEDYFLYYEEVDWALKRGTLPLALCPDALVYHQGGSAIGSPTLARQASSFSLYYKHRARMMFLNRHRPQARRTGLTYGWAKAAQLGLQAAPKQAIAVLRGQHAAR